MSNDRHQEERWPLAPLLRYPRDVHHVAPIGAMTRGEPVEMSRDALLLTLGELLEKELTAEGLLHRIVDVMARLLRADRGTLYILDDEADELVCIAAHLPEISTLRVPKQHGVCGYVARTGRTVNLPYCDDDVRFYKDVDERTGYLTVTMLAGPLRTKSGRLIGVAQFLNKVDGIFTADDEETLALLTEQVAAFLDETTFGAGVGPSSLEDSPSLLPMGDQINRIVGSGRAMREVFKQVRRAAATSVTVLLRGESGTGKGLVARAIHHNSARRGAPFVHIDCTTLPDGLMENELFGHERGAYTGADARSIGKVDAARGGTLFLDEIGDLPLALQGKLLTLVQDRRFHRVGGSVELEADIRIVAATNRELETLVADGRFREDLYYRLRVVQLVVPPLRERGEDDLHRLLHHFVRSAARRHDKPIPTLRQDALDVLARHPWPGNVRELENCIESAVIFADDVITPSMLPLARSLGPRSLPALRPAAKTAVAELFTGEPTLKELEGQYLRALLARHGENRSALARILGIGRNTLLRKLREHGLEG